MLTSKFDTSCPLENDGDKIELEFPFSAPNLPSAVSMTKFRYIWLRVSILSFKTFRWKTAEYWVKMRSNKTDKIQKNYFRIIGLEETASNCQSILEPSFNNQVICCQGFGWVSCDFGGRFRLWVHGLVWCDLWGWFGLTVGNFLLLSQDKSCIFEFLCLRWRRHRTSTWSASCIQLSSPNNWSNWYSSLFRLIGW